jgi:hypothetical protein
VAIRRAKGSLGHHHLSPTTSREELRGCVVLQLPGSAAEHRPEFVPARSCCAEVRKLLVADVGKLLEHARTILPLSSLDLTVRGRLGYQLRLGCPCLMEDSGMSIEVARRFFFWCAIINYAILLLWSALVMFWRDGMYRLLCRWYRVSTEQFDAMNLFGITIYKIEILLFNLVPCIALYLVG